MDPNAERPVSSPDAPAPEPEPRVATPAPMRYNQYMGPHTLSRRAQMRQILDAIRRIVQALHESSRQAERAVGLTGAQLFVLQKLAESPRLSLNELAERTHTHQSSVSTVVSRLVEQGLVRRGQSASDARRLELSLTSRGRVRTARAPLTAQDRLIRSVDRMPNLHRQQLAARLTDLVDGLEPSTEHPAMFFASGSGHQPAGRQRRRGGARTERAR